MIFGLPVQRFMLLLESKLFFIAILFKMYIHTDFKLKEKIIMKYIEYELHNHIEIIEQLTIKILINTFINFLHFCFNFLKI